ncbi:MAG: MFS transporter [Chitinophagales bacterium]|nr:MFS transporter [Chitinophagales bacterium]MDW8417845.1 MFS transporter [Chitinophagales bacterium]
MKEKIQHARSIFTSAVIVAALGYFVDIYDLLLFSVVWKPSLKDIGISPDALVPTGEMLINIQMTGLLLGGILWGVMGDKRGRLSVLFGSIVTYSLANILNGFIDEVWQYGLLRFIAGIGLAGELGAGITLVAESLPKEKRGWGTMLVAAVGVSGAVFASMMWRVLSDNGQDISAWRTCYFIGGALGLALLIMRIGVYESGMFTNLVSQHVERGNFLKLFTDRERFLRYLRCVLVGLPTWFSIGVLVTFCQSFAEQLGVRGTVESGIAIMYAYSGITVGDFAAGYLSQILRSRRKALVSFLLITALGFVLYFTARGASAAYFYAIITLIGFGTGFWAVVVTNAAEQFGTNLRNTVATTVPNFIRGSLPVLMLLYKGLQTLLPPLQSAAVVAALCIAVPLLAVYYSAETYGKDLEYVEV